MQIWLVARSLELAGNFGRGCGDHAWHGEIECAAIIQARVEQHQLGVRRPGAPGRVRSDVQRSEIVHARGVWPQLRDRFLDALQVLRHSWRGLLGERAAVHALQPRSDHLWLA